MKNFLVLAALSFAMLSSANAATLKDKMKLIGQNFKAIGMGIQTTGITPALLQPNHELDVLLNDATLLLPDSIAQMPAEKQPTATIRYKKLMLQLHMANLDLETGIRAADAAAVNAALSVMSDLKAQGHKEFDL